MAIPPLLLILLPIPAIALTILLLLYHATPLLRLPHRPAPLLASLSRIIPHPRRNLPREFFNLPPRSDGQGPQLTPGIVLGVQGKLMLLLASSALLSIAGGWGYLLSSSPKAVGGLAVSVTLLPATTMWLAIFINAQYGPPTDPTVSRIGTAKRMILGDGGIIHASLPRIAIYSWAPTALISIICIAVPSAAKILLLVCSSFCLVTTLGVSLRARYRGKEVQRGTIRLASPCPSSLPTPVSPFGDEQKVSMSRRESGMEGLSDWVSSPGEHPPFHYTLPIVHRLRTGDAPTASSFSYSPSYRTPRSGDSERHKTQSTTTNGTPTSWLTSPTTTPATVPEWEYSPISDTLATPAPARTRPRSRSPSPSLPRAPSRENLRTKGSETTLGDRTYLTNVTTPGAGSRGADGSVLGAYSPEPWGPMPRTYQSLASYPYPTSPYDHDNPTTSRITLATHPMASSDSFAFVPSNRGPSASRAASSTWTLESYHSAMETFQTPLRATGRRAAPPPPIPDLPLPPTPSAGRSETLFDWPVGKESCEMLMVDRERDWVEVEGFVDGSEGWGPSGRGVGVVAVVGLAVCYALATPMVIQPTSDASTILYLLSLLIPPPILAIISYQLRYRPSPIALPITSTRSAKTSKTSATSHHLSLALQTPSQLSLPISISPKLTPPTANPPPAGIASRLPRILEPKPSISNFGWTRSLPNRRHTIFGGLPEARDLRAEDAMRRTMARRSADAWVMEGHAHASDGLWKRTTEMLKPVPALRVLDGPVSVGRPRLSSRGGEAGEGAMKKLRSGITSLLPTRWSQHLRPAEYDEYATRISTEIVAVPPPLSPIAIEITSPSKYDRRRVSKVSTYEGEGDTEGTLGVEGLGEVKMAQKGRMSASPTFVFSGPRPGSSPAEEGYELDWVTAGVLPGFGDDIRVRPSSTIVDQDVTPKKSTAQSLHSRAESLGGTPRGHGRSTSIDYSPTSSSPVKSSIRNRKSPTKSHASKLSLPDIPPSDFDDVRRSFESVGRDDYGVDMPPFPTIDFSASSPAAGDVGDVSQITTLSAMAAIYREAEMTLGTPRHRLTSDATTVHLTPATRKMAALARKAEDELKTPSTNRTSRSATSRRFEDADASPEITPEMINSLRFAMSSKESPSSGTVDHSRLSARRTASLSDEVGMTSLISEDQAMADEMEQVLLMGSPKRAEYVISPHPGDRSGMTGTLSSKSSRASWMAPSEHLYDLDKDTFGVQAPRKASSASTLGSASTYTSWSDGPDALPPVPPMPIGVPVGEGGDWKFPVYPPRADAIPSAHPHPTRPTSMLEQHRPIQPHPSMQSLLRKKSTETMASASTFEYSPPKWEPSKKELEMLQTLKERAAVRGSPVKAEAREQKAEARKGLRELKLANTENANKRASRLAAKEGKRSSVLGKHDGLPKPPMRAPGSPGKVSKGSGKENAGAGAGRRSKPSNNSGLSGLRA